VSRIDKRLSQSAQEMGISVIPVRNPRMREDVDVELAHAAAILSGTNAS
jgi:hypothetical protein